MLCFVPIFNNVFFNHVCRAFSAHEPASTDDEAFGACACGGREQRGARVPWPGPRRPVLRAPQVQRTSGVRVIQSGQRALRG